MIRGMAKKFVGSASLAEAIERATRTALNSPSGTETLERAARGALNSPEFRTAVLDAVRSPEFLSALYPHLFYAAHNPDLRGSDLPGNFSRVDKGTQIQLMLQYRELARAGGPMPSFDDIGFRTFSQFDEDGILLYILSLIGMKTRTSVEICAGVGYECNTANLIVNHNFHGLLFDGNPDNVAKAKAFYQNRPDTLITPPVVAHAWIEPETIDGLIRDHGFSGEVDVFSLDMDGVDYWVWKAIRCIEPRVVVVEYHSSWGPDEAMTVPNIKGFRYSDEKGAFCGASLAAFNKLARERDYRLVGCNRNRLNAFFVRNGLADDLLPEVSVASCLDHPRIRLGWDYIRSVIMKWDWETV
jgi:hypothetical protein